MEGEEYELPVKPGGDSPLRLAGLDDAIRERRSAEAALRGGLEQHYSQLGAVRALRISQDRRLGNAGISAGAAHPLSASVRFLGLHEAALVRLIEAAAHHLGALEREIGEFLAARAAAREQFPADLLRRYDALSSAMADPVAMAVNARCSACGAALGDELTALRARRTPCCRSCGRIVCAG